MSWGRTGTPCCRQPAALVLVNHQENFRRRVADSVAVRVTRSIAQLLAFVGVVAGFWLSSGRSPASEASAAVAAA